LRAWISSRARIALELTTSPLGRRVGLVAGLALFAAIAAQLAVQIHRGDLSNVSIRPWALVASIGVACAADLALAASWRSALTFAGHGTHAAEAGGILLVAQIAKYVPGGVLQIASRVGVGARRGVPARASGTALVAEWGGLTVAGLATSALLVMPWPIWIVLVLVAFVLASVPRARRIAPLRRLVAWHLVVIVLLGVSADLLFHAGGFSAGPASHVVGAYALAWVAGFLVVFAPGGLGVREAVFVALLAGTAGKSAALSVAVASRVVTVVADLLMGGAGAALLWRRAPSTLLHRPADGDR